MPKPQSLREYYLQQAEIFQPALDAPKPDYLDMEHVSEQQIEDYITNYVVASHRRHQIQTRIHDGLKTLTDEQLKEVYNKIKGPQTNKRVTEEYFISQIRSGSTDLHLNAALFGDSIDHMMDVYGEALGPEKVAQIVNAPIRPNPLSPDYKESKVYNPQESYIRALQDKYTHTDDPAKNAENERLLERVSRSLQDVKPKVLETYHSPRSNLKMDDYECYDNIIGRRVEKIKQKGLEQLGDGQFKELVTPSQGPDGAPEYNILEESQFPNPMTEQQEQTLDRLSKDPKTGLSEDTRQSLRELSRCFDELHYEEHSGAPLNGQFFPLQRPTKPDDSYFPSEEGFKYYAFRPLANAKRSLIAAVKEGDLEKIRQAQEKYEQVERTLDKAFGILKSDKLSSEPLFSPNVESTRSSTGDLPEKYALDTTNQKKLNCLYVTYATLKSAGMTLEDLYSDPAGTAKRLGKQLLGAGGVNARPESIGATLQNGMKGSCMVGNADLELKLAWNSLDVSMTRGMGGILGMEKDPKRRAEFAAAFHLGMRSATQEVQKEAKRYETMSKISSARQGKYAAMRGTIYQTAALCPETGKNALDLERMLDNFDREDQVLVPGLDPEEARPDQIRRSWQDDMDAVNTLASGNGAYDWTALAQRNRKVLDDAAREELVSGSYKSFFDPDAYLLHAFSAQSRLAKNAAARGENSAEFQAFREGLKNTYTMAKNPNVRAILKMGGVLLDDPAAFDFLKTGKSDQLSKTDSDEYKQMKKSLAKVQKVKKLLTSGDPTDAEKLYAADFCGDLEKAKQDAFNYVRLKTKNGKKTSFHYNSGLQRAREGMENYKKLVRLQDELGLRSPAQKAYEDAREALLTHRDNAQWMNGPEGKAALAKMLYAKSFMEAGIPDEHQKAAFRPEALSKGVNSLLRNVLHVYQNPGELSALADEALENKGLFKQGVENLAAQRKAHYDRTMAETRLKQAKQDCIKGFALDKACEALKINHTQQTYSVRNPAIQAKAEEIMKDPDFQEIMRRITEGKTLEQIEGMHKPAALESGAKGEIEYDRAAMALKYEKRCAAVAAEATLRSKNEGREPTREEIDRAAEVLRKDQRFLSFVQSKESAFRGGEDYANATGQLSIPEHRNRFLTEMAQQLAEPAPRQPAPNAGQQQLQQNEANRQNGVIQQNP